MSDHDDVQHLRAALEAIIRIIERPARRDDPHSEAERWNDRALRARDIAHEALTTLVVPEPPTPPTRTCTNPPIPMTPAAQNLPTTATSSATTTVTATELAALRAQLTQAETDRDTTQRTLTDLHDWITRQIAATQYNLYAQALENVNAWLTQRTTR